MKSVRKPPPRLVTALVLTACLAACSPNTTPSKASANAVAAGDLNADKLNTEIDSAIGGLGTCVIMLDTSSGRELYHYGAPEACLAKLPPCATFDIPNTLIGLDQGVITPQAVVKWDGTPQPVAIWQTDADLAKAFQGQIGWWFQHLATGLGHDRYASGLSALDYGDHNLGGPITAFWMGPQAGGGLTVTEGQQADFIRRFYAGDLRVKPDAITLTQGLTQDETRTDAKGAPVAISGRTASCASASDGSRNVGWWIGRIRSAQHDLSFSASVEGTEAPPGLEIERRLKDIFSDAGVIPAG